MSVHTVLRTVQRMMAGATVAAVAATGVLTGSAATSSATPEVAIDASPVVLAAKHTQVAAVPGSLAYERKVAFHINRTRKRHGLRYVRWATCTDTVANRWSKHLARTDQFRHQSMQKLLRRCDARYAGETLGRGSMTPAQLVAMWMASPPHRRVLLSRSPRRLGIGAVPTASGSWVVTANFMRL